MYTRVSGIYGIKSLVHPDRIYVGSTVDFRKRWREHKLKLSKGQHANPKLQCHYNKYGESDFVFSIIECCDKDNLVDKEQFYIDTLNPFFNIEKDVIKKQGQLGEDNPFYGKKHTEESKQLMREYRLGTHPSDETRQKMRESRAKHGMPKHTQKSKDKISETQKKRLVGYYDTDAGKDLAARRSVWVREARFNDTDEVKEKRRIGIKRAYKNKAIGRLLLLLLINTSHE